MAEAPSDGSGIYRSRGDNRACLGTEEKDFPIKTLFDPALPPDRVYPRFRITVTTTATPSILLVNLSWLSAALHGDSSWCENPADRNGGSYKPGSYSHAISIIEANGVFEMPWLYFVRGRTRVTDGRHRLYALIDKGFTHCPIVVDDDDLAPISTLVETQKNTSRNAFIWTIE
jgi:hypothetical protein